MQNSEWAPLLNVPKQLFYLCSHVLVDIISPVTTGTVLCIFDYRRKWETASIVQTPSRHMGSYLRVIIFEIV